MPDLGGWNIWPLFDGFSSVFEKKMKKILCPPNVVQILPTIQAHLVTDFSMPALLLDHLVPLHRQRTTTVTLLSDWQSILPPFLVSAFLSTDSHFLRTILRMILSRTCPSF